MGDLDIFQALKRATYKKVMNVPKAKKGTIIKVKKRYENWVQCENGVCGGFYPHKTKEMCDAAGNCEWIDLWLPIKGIGVLDVASGIILIREPLTEIRENTICGAEYVKNVKEIDVQLHDGSWGNATLTKRSNNTYQVYFGEETGKAQTKVLSENTQVHVNFLRPSGSFENALKECLPVKLPLEHKGLPVVL